MPELQTRENTSVNFNNSPNFLFVSTFTLTVYYKFVLFTIILSKTSSNSNFSLFYTAKKDLVFFSESLEKFKFKQGQRKEIPCKPTHPEVRVTVKRTNRFRATNENLSKVSVWSLSWCSMWLIHIELLGPCLMYKGGTATGFVECDQHQMGIW